MKQNVKFKRSGGSSPLADSAPSTNIEAAEVCYVLLGELRGGLVHAKMQWRKKGSPASVAFDWSKVVKREKSHSDIVGFYHTHPPGYLDMSMRDETTMRAWAFCFGKPLLCVIASIGASFERGRTDSCTTFEKEHASGHEGELALRSWLVYPNGKIVPCDQTAVFQQKFLVASIFDSKGNV